MGFTLHEGQAQGPSYQHTVLSSETPCARQAASLCIGGQEPAEERLRSHHAPHDSFCGVTPAGKAACALSSPTAWGELHTACQSGLDLAVNSIYSTDLGPPTAVGPGSCLCAPRPCTCCPNAIILRCPCASWPVCFLLDGGQGVHLAHCWGLSARHMAGTRKFFTG